jgi:hypothetical protein
VQARRCATEPSVFRNCKCCSPTEIHRILISWQAQQQKEEQAERPAVAKLRLPRAHPLRCNHPRGRCGQVLRPKLHETTSTPILRNNSYCSVHHAARWRICALLWRLLQQGAESVECACALVCAGHPVLSWAGLSKISKRQPKH